MIAAQPALAPNPVLATREWLTRPGLVAGLRWLGQPAIVLGLLFAAVYSFVAICRYRRMLAGVDLALFTEAVQGYSVGRSPISTIKTVGEFNLLGDHFTPAVALLAPVYRLVPHAWEQYSKPIVRGGSIPGV